MNQDEVESATPDERAVEQSNKQLKAVNACQHEADRALTAVVLTANRMAEMLTERGLGDEEFRSLASAALMARSQLRQGR